MKIIKIVVIKVTIGQNLELLRSKLVFNSSILVLKVTVWGLVRENHQNLLLKDQIFVQIYVFQVNSCSKGQNFGFME